MVFLHFEAEQVVVLPEHVALALVINDARMVAACAVGGTHDVALHFPRAGGVFGHGVADALGAACGSVGQVILAVALVEPRAFLIVLQLAHAHDSAAIRNHVFVQRHVVQVRVAPVHVSLAVVVNPHRRVNVFPMLLLPHERLAEGVFERPVG